MRIAVIDGLGGGIGTQIVAQLKQELGDKAEIIALGTNSVATDRMVRAGAHRGATGENAIRVMCAHFDLLVAPIGVVLPDAMMGEISPSIATSVFGCKAEKILIPIVQQHFTLAGYEPKPVAALIAEAVGLAKTRLSP